MISLRKHDSSKTFARSVSAERTAASLPYVVKADRSGYVKVAVLKGKREVSLSFVLHKKDYTHATIGIAWL